MKSNILILFTCSIVIFVSCTSTPNVAVEILRKAEQCMETRPDSALQLLKQIVHSSDFTEVDRADYLLLMAEARDKNYMDMSMDSSVVYSVDYFKNSDDRGKYGKALYYYGRFVQANRNPIRATKIYLEACRVLEGTEEYKVLGLTYSNLAIFNREQSLYAEAIRCCRQAIDYYYRVEDTLAAAYTYQTLGSIYFNTLRMDSVYYYATKSTQLLQDNPLRLKLGSSKLLGMMYFYEKKYEQAEKNFLNILEEIPDKSKLAFHYISLGHLYQLMGKKEEAEKYLMLSMDSPSYFTRSGAYRYLSELAKAEDDFEKALFLKEKSDSLYAIAENEKEREALLQLQAQFKDEERDKELLTVELNRQTAIFNFSIVLLILGVLAYFLYRKYGYAKLQLRKMNKELIQNNAKIKLFQSEIDRYRLQEEESGIKERFEMEELNRKMKILVDRNRKLLQRVDVVYLVRMLKQGNLLVKDLQTVDIDKIFGLVNSLYGNLLDRLTGDRASLTKHDKKLLAFLLLDFQTKELAAIFETKDDHSIFKAKSRLKERLELKKDELLDSFLDVCRKRKLK